MKKLHAEWQIVRRPERPVPAKADFAVLVVIEAVLPQHPRQIGARRVKRLARAIESALRHVIQIDLGGFRPDQRCAGQHQTNG
jgi:hypothetical protein